MQRITKFIFKFSVCIISVLSSGLVFSQDETGNAKATEDQEKGIPITGIVRDANTGEPLSGINLAVPKYSATITGDDGSFSINVPSLNTPIILSAEGFQTKEYAIRGELDHEIYLYEEGYPTLSDRIITPIGPKFQNKLPFATASIKADESLYGSSVNESVGTWVQGKVPGLFVTRRSGTPNVGADILLRGYNSLYTSNRPLIVVDGMIYDDTDYGRGMIENFFISPLSNIDIKDIQEVTFIKDGSSIYGTKGGNGVMMITTTRPEDLSTKIDFMAFGGYNQEPDELPLLGARDFRIYLSQMLASRGMTQSQLQSQPFMNDNQSFGDYYRYHNNTNWQDQVFNEQSYNQNYYLKIRGGDNIAKYALSVGYLSNDGIIKNTHLERYNTRFNADLQLTPKLRMLANISFVYGEQDLKNQGLGSATSPLNLALSKSPFLTTNVIDTEGNLSPNLADSDEFGVSNPEAILQNAVGINRNYRFFGNLNFGYEFNDSFSLNSILGLTYSKVRENFFIPNLGVVNDTLSNAVITNRSGSEIQRFFSLYNDTYLDFNKAFRSHSIDLRIGVRTQSNEAETDYGLGFNASTDDFTNVGAGTNALRRVGGSLGDWNWINGYLATNYGFLNKYFLSVNFAVDGSSRFGDDAQDWALGIGDNQFAFLPSVAGAWLISSEPYLSMDFINLLKLRASYGLSGNDDIGNYTASKYYESQNLLGLQGLVRGNIGNSQLQWEVVHKANIGVDLSILKERISASADVFSYDTQNMLIFEPAPAGTGLELIASNSGSMKTEGYEGSLNARLINRGLKFDLGLNLSHYKNTVTGLPSEEIITEFGGATFITREGLAPNLYYGLHSSGVFTTNQEAVSSGLQKRMPNGDLVPFGGGDMIFSDLNNDNIIDGQDRAVIGDPNPQWVGMLNSKISFGDFTLDAMFNFSYGNDLYNGTRAMLEGMSGYENQSQAVLNRWRANGQETTIPKATWGDPMGNAFFSSRWIEDGSYIKLRTLILSYDLPAFSETIRYAQIYATGNNLFTVTDYLGYDPEFSAGTSMFTKGVDIGLVPHYRTVQLGFRLGL
jgi:TonB-linked SusC/RagA family outer membrane protein